MNLRPNELKLLNPDQLQITWSDGQVRRYEVAELRRSCPCASCGEKRRAEPKAELLPVVTLDPPEAVRLKGVNPIGNYAYEISFADGHNTGIYTFEYLRELGEAVEP